MKKFNVPNIYKSSVITAIKEKRKQADKLKKDFTPTLLPLGNLNIYLARHFGFCYGVENAIEIAFNTIAQNPDKRIFLLSEMIHNPQVNADLQQRGIQFLQDTYGKQLIPFDEISGDDIVLVPAFGTTLQIEELLLNKGIAVEKYNTTCPFVEKVWNRSAQVADKGYTVVIHGKPKHEETRATFSHAAAHAASVIVNDMKEAEALACYIRKEKSQQEFEQEFAGRFSAGFDIQQHLQKIGVVNQTTQLATETQAIADYLKHEIVSFYAATDVSQHFADTRDTLCYATNDNQTAVTAMLQTQADAAIIIGGYNSSNTSHLVELCEQQLPAYFINDASNIVDAKTVNTCNWRTKEVTTISPFLPDNTPVNILITSGASCPDALVEQVIEKLCQLHNCLPQWEQVKQHWLN